MSEKIFITILKLLKMKKLIIFTACLSVGLSFAVTHYVATNGNNISPYTNWANAATDIHSAIDVAGNGDIIIVSNGTYNISSAIAITNTTVTLRSLNHAANTIINAQNSCRAVFIDNNSIFDGFTVSNANFISDSETPGAGVSVDNGKIKNCIITHCNATFAGGLFLGENTRAENCVIKNNSAERAGGGVVVMQNAKLIDSMIFNNNVSSLGDVTNYFFGGGGALCFYGGEILDSVISNNYSVNNGGGVYIAGSGDVQRCEIIANDSEISGGGAFADNGGFLQSCLLIDNSAVNGGGAYILTNGLLQNCTLADNLATNGGGTFFADGGSTINSLIFFNNADNGDNFYVQNDASFFYCGTSPSVSNVYDSGGNATNLPQFVNRSIDNYRLLQSSFYVDSGTNIQGIFQLADLDRNSRVSNIVERGAYELFGYPLPYIAVTTEQAVVSYDIPSLAFAGTNNEFAINNFKISNSANGVVSNFSNSGLSWNSPALPLAVGSNMITVSAQNEGRYIAYDSVLIIRLDIGSGAPFVDITNQNTSVIFDINSFFVSGTNNCHTVSELWITNQNNGYYNRFFPTTGDWFSVEVPLATLTNIICVYGSNVFGQITNDCFTVIRSPGTGAPFVDITSQVSFVTYDTTSIAVAGTNNAQIAGMWLSNSIAGTIDFPAAESWTAPSVPLAVGTNYIFVFGSNSLTQVDDDFIEIIRGSPGTGMPFIDCTNENREVENSVSEIILAGTNNLNVVGKMKIYNPLTGEQKIFTAAQEWTAPPVSLEDGINDITISGTNIYGDVDNDLVLITRKGPATGPPFVDIITTSQWLNYDFDSLILIGTNNLHVTGAMWISNSVNHEAHFFSSSPVWTSSPIALVVGANSIFVFGQNAAGAVTSDFVVISRGIPGTGMPVIQITNANKFVTFDVSEIQIAGLANSNVVGTMIISNLLNNSTANFAALSAWQAPSLPLDVGTNSFIVYGTNLFGETGTEEAVIIREGPGSGVPFLDILTTNTFVGSDILTFSVEGTNNPNISGFMWISNSANADVQSFPASNSWLSSAVALQIGWNDIYVFGSNLVNQVTNDAVRITRGTPGLGTPVITISTTNSTLNYDFNSIIIEGSVNFNVMGGMWLSNSANGATVRFDATQYWHALIPLGVGINSITAYGTNFLNDVASDSITITRLGPGTGAPFINITNANLIVKHDVASFVTAGTNNLNVVGYMWISNSSDSLVQSFPAAHSWLAPQVNLDKHLNHITVFGSNIYGDITCDSIIVDRPVPSGVTNFVSISGSHEWPFITWETAATNIEAAVNEAVDGNTVLVADGTNYIYSTMTVDKNIVLKSVSGSGSSIIIIKSQSVQSPFNFSKVVVDGFAFAQGYIIPVVSNGACFTIGKSSIIKNSIFKNFTALKYGGAVYCDDGLISNCTFHSCYAVEAGGAVYINNGATIIRSVVSNNFAANGAGVYIAYTGTVDSCELSQNHTFAETGAPAYKDAGAAVYCDNGGTIINSKLYNNFSKNGSAVYFISDGKIINCEIYDNLSEYYAAIYCEFGGEVINSKIYNNSALNGAGVTMSYGAEIKNSLVVNNLASYRGGGIYSVGYNSIVSSTISSNSAGEMAGGIYSDDLLSVNNSIIYFNFADECDNYSEPDASFAHCCTTPLPSGQNNISDDPKLANPFTGFFKLAADSPCVNAGTNSDWMTSASDINGNPRILSNIVDIGCCEFTNEPIIWTSLLTIDFGDVLIDTFVTSVFTVGNAGDQILNGQVEQIASPFFVDYGAPYSIDGLTNSEIAILFAPSEETNYFDEILLSGDSLVTITLKGTGIPEPHIFILIILITATFKFVNTKK